MMKIKCESKNFFKIYNEMQGVGFKASKLCKTKGIKVHHYTTYILLYFLVTVVLALLAIFSLQEYNILFVIVQILLFFLIFIILAMTLLFLVGYYFTSKRLGGEVNISIEGVEDKEKDGLRFFVPWNLIDFVYFGEYGIYFFVRKKIVICGDCSYHEEVRKYLKEKEIIVLSFHREG